MRTLAESIALLLCAWPALSGNVAGNTNKKSGRVGLHWPLMLWRHVEFQIVGCTNTHYHCLIDFLHILAENQLMPESVSRLTNTKAHTKVASLAE